MSHPHPESVDEMLGAFLKWKEKNKCRGGNKARFDNLYGYKENVPFKTKIGLAHL